jgi:hypothetical protein
LLDDPNAVNSHVGIAFDQVDTKAPLTQGNGGSQTADSAANNENDRSLQPRLQWNPWPILPNTRPPVALFGKL